MKRAGNGSDATQREFENKFTLRVSNDVKWDMKMATTNKTRHFTKTIRTL
jgi:hypothetical protein